LRERAAQATRSGSGSTAGIVASALRFVNAGESSSIRIGAFTQV
jgi:hypothetical protein